MIRVGVVGFGMAGRVFHCPLVSSVDGLELAAVVERSTNQASGRYPGVAIYRTQAELLADATIGLVVIATPSGTHYELARQALEAGKSVIVDKPTCTTSDEIAALMKLASERHLQLIPFHNRRWDGDFLTMQKVIHEGSLGKLVSVESNFFRWRPLPRARVWKEKTSLGGGALLDLGTHLMDQALTQWGRPEFVSAEVLREREIGDPDEQAEDGFTIRLLYPKLTVTLGSNCLTTPTDLRFHLRGTKGNFWKWGVDPQESRLGQVVRIEPTEDLGKESSSAWGSLTLDVDGGLVTRPVESITGDYRHYYRGVRDALLGHASAPVKAVDAWEVVRMLEAAQESANQGCRIACDWADEPV